MLRIAKVYSLLLASAIVLIILLSALNELSSYIVGALLMLLPVVLALCAFYSRAPRWLGWAAILLNGVAVCVGLYMVGDALPDLLGLKASSDRPSAAIYLAIALLAFVVPGGLNASALYGMVTYPKPPSGGAAA